MAATGEAAGDETGVAAPATGDAAGDATAEAAADAAGDAAVEGFVAVLATEVLGAAVGVFFLLLPPQLTRISTLNARTPNSAK